jgi:hypothetical protein
MYEIDPYDPEVVTKFPGFRTDTCLARQRFLRMWSEDRKWLKKKIAG